MEKYMFSRRKLLKLLFSAPFLTQAFPLHANQTKQLHANKTKQAILRKIPSSNEVLPVVGMGSYQTFNVAENSVQAQTLIEVLKAFFAAGGRFIDSSPMYGKSEEMIGQLVEQITPRPEIFAASKVWTYGKQAGLDAIAESQKRMKVDKMDLMQVHNLRDWSVHLPTLNQLKQQNQLRYCGITTSFLGQYQDFEAVMNTQALDFVQINYNIKVREAEKRLLPLAMDKGMAVIVNMPFEKGRLFKFIRGVSLPEWAKEFDCESWGQFFLKFIISHPAVTCVIPATSKVHHMKDNMQAMYGRLPDAKMRQKMLQFFESI